ncbi:hypothetical protein LCGC14_2321410 [marine sediment metagenome]|uniref:Uncharacterized protein n=1 Tax=marine sediment metagenome TaxID=412755 RepID=A0A0F9FCI3_9ZZZZ
MHILKLGLVLRQGRFVWKLHAWYWWIPGQALLVHVWNGIACRIWGHEDALWHLYSAGTEPLGEVEPVCYNCCKRLTGCVGHDDDDD